MKKDRDALLKESLKKHFANQVLIPKENLINFLRTFFPEAKDSTLTWRIYDLTQAGVLVRMGWGAYSISLQSNFSPPIPLILRQIANHVQNALPYIDCCIWDSRVLADFMNQQPMGSLLLVEVERVAVDSVHQLIRKKSFYSKRKPVPVFLYQDWLTISRHWDENISPIIVKPLISEAPLQQLDGYKTASLEKILVDLLAEEPLFFAYQEELSQITRIAFKQYVINRDKLRRYARRRNKADQIDDLLDRLPLIS